MNQLYNNYTFSFPLQGPVQFKVAVPNMPDKAEWKLNGQILGFTLPLTDAVRTYECGGNYLGFLVLNNSWPQVTHYSTVACNTAASVW